MQVILKYFADLSKKQIKQFSELQELYEHWNAQINVISRKDISELYINHVLHSLALAKVVQFEKGTKILDIGTGGGFPGIPLAILFPNVDFLLVDSIGKKIKVEHYSFLNIYGADDSSCIPQVNRYKEEGTLIDVSSSGIILDEQLISFFEECFYKGLALFP